MPNRVESAYGNYCPHCATPHDNFRLLQQHVRDVHHLHLRSAFGERNTAGEENPRTTRRRAARGTIPNPDDAVS